jgi:quinol-cytochrome oxidoreductase complex cytochrome b subunit
MDFIGTLLAYIFVLPVLALLVYCIYLSEKYRDEMKRIRYNDYTERSAKINTGFTASFIVLFFILQNLISKHVADELVMTTIAWFSVFLLFIALKVYFRKVYFKREKRRTKE